MEQDQEEKGPGRVEVWDPAAASEGKAAAVDPELRRKGAVKAVVKAVVKGADGDREKASGNNSHQKNRAVLPRGPRGVGPRVPARQRQ